MRHQGRPRLAGQANDIPEPAGEGLVVKAGEGLRLTKAGRVGDNDAVVLDQSGDHGRPVGAAALDPAVQQQQRRARAALEERGGDAAGIESPLVHRKPGEQALAGARAPRVLPDRRARRPAGHGPASTSTSAASRISTAIPSASRLHNTTGIVSLRISVGLNSTISVPA